MDLLSKWSMVAHFILPDFELRPEETAEMALTRYRAQCQITLAKWLAAREAEGL